MSGEIWDHVGGSASWMHLVVNEHAFGSRSYLVLPAFGGGMTFVDVTDEKAEALAQPVFEALARVFG
jgi:hypothetical protein